MCLTDRRIILVRHGQTAWNLQRRFQGRTNIPLTDTGRHQASLLAGRVSLWKPEVIYTSPLERAYFTARTVAEKIGLSPVIIPELEEVNFGVWEGRSIPALKDESPEDFSRWSEDPFFSAPEGGETWPEIEARLSAAVSIMLSSPFTRIAAVTHGGIIRALYAVFLGFSPHKTWFIDVPNCSVTGLDIVGGKTYLSFANDSLHIKAAGEGSCIPFWEDGR